MGETIAFLDTIEQARRQDEVLQQTFGYFTAIAANIAGIEQAGAHHVSGKLITYFPAGRGLKIQITPRMDSGEMQVYPHYADQQKREIDYALYDHDHPFLADTVIARIESGMLMLCARTSEAVGYCENTADFSLDDAEVHVVPDESPSS